MPNIASSFVNGRQDPTAITRKRIEHIVWYSIECYKLLVSDNPTYSKQYVKESTSFTFEDYLKMEFVDNYLIKNKNLLSGKLSPLEEINFNYETVKRYSDNLGIEKSDKIDIIVSKLGLNEYLKIEEENIYFVYECKRISKLSDSKAYISDIQKFADRNYRYRLPFEGMIGFIENEKISHITLAQEINNLLKTTTTIRTNQYLGPIKLSNTLLSNYLSSHFKNNHDTEIFSVYHLLFDYSQYVKS